MKRSRVRFSQAAPSKPQLEHRFSWGFFVGWARRVVPSCPRLFLLLAHTERTQSAHAPMWLTDPMTAELDYAFLAEFAKTEKGTLSVIGASFTQVVSHSYPGMLELSVAGRIRRLEEDPAPLVAIRFYEDGDEADLVSTERLLEDEDDAVHYAGKVASIFVLRGPLFLENPGLYRCDISINGEVVRTLAFEALPADD